MCACVHGCVGVYMWCVHASHAHSIFCHNHILSEEFTSFRCWYVFLRTFTCISCPLILRYFNRASWMNTYCFSGGRRGWERR